VAMDLYYVQNWSLGFDLKILIWTPLRVVRGAGAY
jgi:lipopolysaccharide/colanic/teichoic acid biosynthesis glycosyltransferase